MPVADASRIYETNATTGKKKAKLWNYFSTGRAAISNSDLDTKREPGLIASQSIDYIKYFSQYNLQGYSKDTFYKELQIEFDNAMESIEKYGGFYIGRYETGNVTSAIPVVRRMNNDLGNQNWYQMYFKIQSISANSNIYTSMIWGSLWDEILQWLIDTEEKTQIEVALDSTNWGKYERSKNSYGK